MFVFRINKLFLLLVFALVQYSNALAWRVSGVVTEPNGTPVAYASVYEENTTYGVATNIKGEFAMELGSGMHRIVFQAVGFERKVLEVSVVEATQLNVQLQPNAQMLNAVTITAEGEDPAYPIIRSAMEARKRNNRTVKEYACDVYSKVSLEKEFFTHDTLSRKERDTIENILAKERRNFVETKSRIYHQAPDRWKEEKIAVNDKSIKKGSEVAVTFNDGSENLDYGAEKVNRQMFKTDISQVNINFYENTINEVTLSSVPYSSPIGIGALLNYSYHLEESFQENGRFIHKIQVTPKRKFASLFEGYIYIADSIWTIKALDLEADNSQLYYFNYFRIIQEFEPVKDTNWLLSREEFFYETKDGKAREIGNTQIIYSNYDLNPKFPPRFFGNLLSLTLDDAYEKGNGWWDSIRPITLKDEELIFIEEQDSIDAFHKSVEFLQQEDSIANHLKIWDFLLSGIYHQNSFTKVDWNIYPLIQQIRPAGIGGYRHALGGGYSKEFLNSKKISMNGELNYGFLTSEVKGFIRADFIYNPKHFGRLHLEYRNVFDMITQFTSFQTIFAMSNYVQDIFYSIGHDYELVNGVYLDATLEYGERLPITGIKLAEWTKTLFGEYNEPTAFTPFRRFNIDLKVKFTPYQKYKLAPRKKVVLPNSNPVFTIWYIKAIPDVFRSNANFDFLELKAEQHVKIGTIGTTKWKVWAGSYLNAGNVPITDFRYFRRSDPWYFSNPLLSFQLLRPGVDAIRTSNPFVQANYVHNFENLFTNKIPFIKRAGLTTIAGAGFLYVDDLNFTHAETFGGLEWPFKLWKQRFKIGAYYTVGSSTVSPIVGEFKFGIDFFNEWTNSWSY